MKTPCTDGVCLVAEARGEHLRCQGACAYTPTPTDTPRTDAQRERDRTLVSAAMRLREWEELCDKLERELSAMLAVARQNGDDLDEARSELSALRAANELPCCDAKNDVTPGGCYRAVHAENELARLRASTAGMPEGPHEINYADRRGYAGKQPWVWLDDWRRATQRAERAEADLVKAAVNEERWVWVINNPGALERIVLNTGNEAGGDWGTMIQNRVDAALSRKDQR